MSRTKIMEVMEQAGYIHPYHKVYLSFIQKLMEAREVLGASYLGLLCFVKKSLEEGKIADLSLLGSNVDMAKVLELFKEYKYRFYLECFKDENNKAYYFFDNLHDGHLGLDQYYLRCFESDYYQVYQD